MIGKFLDRVRKDESGCHIWEGYVTKDGYGRFWNGATSQPAHRAAYELFVGEIPDGLEIDHLCAVRNCVNTSHLEAVTRQENIARSDPGAYQREKDACPKGHEYTGDNLYVHGGRRSCKSCRNDASARYRKRITDQRHLASSTTGY